MAQESRARGVAEQLAAEFLKTGSYEAARGSIDIRAAGVARPAVGGLEPVQLTDYGFTGLSVQAVGYTPDSDEETVQVFVSRGSKRLLNGLSRDVNGIKVEFMNLGRLVIRPEAVIATGIRGNVFEHNGRIACGSSCAPAGQMYSGTFGALVHSNSQMMALSNNHVFACCNHIPVGQPILSPSAADAAPEMPAPRELCRHSKIVELRSGTPDLVDPVRCDAAVASVPDESVVSSWQGDDNTGYDTPGHTVGPSINLRVKKVGRTTGLTFGTCVSEVPTFLSIPYKNAYFTATVWFTDVWLVRADGGGSFALPGDSGSLVVTEDSSAAVGLLFAATPTGEAAWIAPIDTVLDELNVTLIGNYGV